MDWNCWVFHNWEVINKEEKLFAFDIKLVVDYQCKDYNKIKRSYL